MHGTRIDVRGTFLVLIVAGVAACGQAAAAPSAASFPSTELPESTFGAVARPPRQSDPVTPVLCTDPQPPFVSDFDVRQTPASARAGGARSHSAIRSSGLAWCGSPIGRLISSPGDPSARAEERVLARAVLQRRWQPHPRARHRGDVVPVRRATLQPLGQLPFRRVGGPALGRRRPERPLLLRRDPPDEPTAWTTRAAALVHDFAADFPGQSLAAVWTKYEGSPSPDGRYWGFMAEDQNWETVAFLVYDQQTDRVIAKRDVRGVPGVAKR